MRKLVLFGLLGAIFGSALLLEHLFARKEPESALAKNKALLTVGGGPPRSIPAEAPAVEDESPIVIESGDAADAGSAGERSRDARRDARRDSQRDASTPSGDRVHVVAAKETLWTIAAAELGSGARWPELAAWNGLEGDAPLRVGAKLRLSPPPAATDRTAAQKPPATEPARPAATTPSRTHKVAKGESLSKIAARYLGDASRWREIQRLNQIADPASVGEGVVLKIPDR
ncbi:MAG: LysM peptidoglycan-binding domain-containing protein [Planctomycetes bacterium]|nr:LysM peptidoglycan-binding domain-containing protein [Planctomycetota bacterium]